ncbi:MAG TPA: hypothetical protein VFV42_04165 [Acidimicrobiales bacterium]|nr:hypothetical protein [Acidimicrobiales bacterium]
MQETVQGPERLLPVAAQERQARGAEVDADQVRRRRRRRRHRRFVDEGQPADVVVGPAPVEHGAEPVELAQAPEPPHEQRLQSGVDLAEVGHGGGVLALHVRAQRSQAGERPRDGVVALEVLFGDLFGDLVGVGQGVGHRALRGRRGAPRGDGSGDRRSDLRSPYGSGLTVGPRRPLRTIAR